MPAMRILYISGSIGLGHINRDLAIVRALRDEAPGVDVSWLAADPASRVLQHAGERLLLDPTSYANDSSVAESTGGSAELNLVTYAFRAPAVWLRHVTTIRRLVRQHAIDLVIGDEVYELVIALILRRELLSVPYVGLNDFVGLDAVSSSLLERLGAYALNVVWSQDRRLVGNGDLMLFVGEIEDVPERSFGPWLPQNRRTYASKFYESIGYVLPFDPARYSDRLRVRARLGYGAAPLVIGAIGGTAIGRDLLELCADAYPLLRRELPDIRMLLVAGPRLRADSVRVPPGVELRSYIPDLYEHFAAADLAVVQGGGTTTLELTALRRPFLFFPLEGQCEQTFTIADRLARQQAGIRMSYARTTPARLAETILTNLGREPAYPPIRTDGALTAARLIAERFIGARGQSETQAERMHATPVGAA